MIKEYCRDMNDECVYCVVCNGSVCVCDVGVWGVCVGCEYMYTFVDTALHVYK